MHIRLNVIRSSRWSHRLLLALILLLLITTVAALPPAHSVAGQPGGVAPPARPVSFIFGVTEPAVTFVFQSTDPATIQQARTILSSGQADDYIIMGVIVKKPALYNPGWSYHLDPQSISFAQGAIEVCDAHPLYVEEHLDEVGGALLPDSRWCPWLSQLITETNMSTLFLPRVTK